MEKQKEKTNMDYLREFIKDNDEAIEFWDAVMEKVKKENLLIIDLKDKVKSLEGKVGNLERDLNECQDNPPYPEVEEIDLGIGIIEYIQPDNLKLQMIMGSLQENPEKLLSI